jgi:hypothetical protein
LAAAIFGGIISVWGVGMAVVVNASSVTDAQAGTMVSAFSPTDERAAMTAIRAAGGLLVANPVAGTWVVHAEEDGFAERLRENGALGVFAKMPLALPGASGCFFLPSGQHALSGNATPVPKTSSRQNERGPRRPLSSHGGLSP